MNKIVELLAQISTKQAILGGFGLLVLFLAFPILMTGTTIGFGLGVVFSQLFLSND